MAESDPAVVRLAELFERHPAWVEAARSLDRSAASAVYFRHLPGEVWQLVFRDGRARLRPGRPASPDFAFRFSAAAVDRLAGVDGGIGDFAVELFGLISSDDPTHGVDLRVVAPFATLVRKGYLKLLWSGGVRVIVYGAKRGFRTLGDLRRWVERIRSDRPQPWETSDARAEGREPTRPQ